MKSLIFQWSWLFLLLTLSAIWFLGFRGILLSDEYLYAEQAMHLSYGLFQISPSAFHNRFALLGPMAGLISAFGTNPKILVLWPFICLLLLLFSIRIMFSPKLAWPLILLLATNPVIGYYSTDVSHDWVMTTFQTLAILILFRFYQSKNQPAWPYFSGFLIATCLFLAFLAKVSVVLVLPFLIWFGWKTITDRTAQKLDFSFLLSSIIFGLSFLAAYYHFTGDPLYRWHGIQGEHNISEWGYAQASFPQLLLRLTVHPLAFFIRDFGVGTPILLAAFLSLSSPSEATKPTRQFAKIYFLSLLILFCWGSSSFSSYNPMVLVDRMWLPLIPAAYLVLLTHSEKIKTWNESPLFKYYAIALAILAFVGNVVFPQQMEDAWQGGLFWLLLALLLFRQTLPNLWILLLIAQLGFTIFMLAKNRQAPLLQEYRWVQSLEKDQKTIIWTDSLLVRMPGVHTDWQQHESLEFRVWDQLELPLEHGKKHYLLINSRRAKIMTDYYQRPLPNLPDSLVNHPALYQSPALQIRQLHSH